MKPVPKVDPHIDVADLFHFFKLEPKDFFSEKDIPVTLMKLKQAGVKALGTTLFFDESFVQTNFYDGVKSLFSWYEELFSQSDDISLIDVFETQEKNENIECFYSIEGFECLRESEDIKEFYDKGVRVFGMTWQNDNAYACGRHTKNDRGISEKGNQVLAFLNKKRSIVDIAHLSEQSVRDLEQVYKGMIVTTHGNCRSVYKSDHNLSDEEIQIIVDRGGVVSLFPLSDDTGVGGTFAELYKHVEHIASKWGEEYVAFSSDIFPLDEYPFLEGYKDVTVLNGIEQELLKHVDRDIVKKMFYDNWIRVFKESL